LQIRIDIDVQKERYKLQEEKLLEREAGSMGAMENGQLEEGCLGLFQNFCQTESNQNNLKRGVDSL